MNMDMSNMVFNIKGEIINTYLKFPGTWLDKNVIFLLIQLLTGLMTEKYKKQGYFWRNVSCQ